MEFFFGMAYGYNDINILDDSSVFHQKLQGSTPTTDYSINNHQYTMGYYLIDDIYLKFATLIQTLSHLTTPKKRLFT